MVRVKYTLIILFYAALSFATLGYSSADVGWVGVGVSNVQSLAVRVGDHEKVNLLQESHIIATRLRRNIFSAIENSNSIKVS
jgi:hypothetical protein